MNRQAVAALALSAMGLVILMPTFNALSTSEHVSAEPPFRLDDPPPITPPPMDPPPGETPEGDGEGEMELPVPPPCNRTKEAVIFDETAGPNRPADHDERLATPNDTLAVFYGFRFDGWNGEFRLQVLRDGEPVDEGHYTRGSLLAPSSDGDERGPFPRERLNETWTLQWEADTFLQGAARVVVAVRVPDCEGGDAA